jgi:hypothetical protein
VTGQTFIAVLYLRAGRTSRISDRGPPISFSRVLGIALERSF